MCVSLCPDTVNIIVRLDSYKTAACRFNWYKMQRDVDQGARRRRMMIDAPVTNCDSDGLQSTASP